MFVDQVYIFRLAVRGEPHEFVFTAVDFEAAIVGKRGVEQTERVRKLEMMGQLDAVATARAERSRRPLPYAVHRQDRGLLKRTGEERARCVALVVVEVHQPRPSQ